MGPHDDGHVAFGIDKLDLDFLEGLKCPLQQAYCMLNSDMYL